jgi:hypothetical protein
MAKKKVEEQVITLPELKLQKATIKIIGETQLVVHSFSKKAMDSIENKQHGKPKNSKHEIRNEWEELIQCLYWITPPPTELTQEAWEQALVNGARFGFKAGGIKDCAVSAAYRRGLVRNMPTARGYFSIINTYEDQLYAKQVVEIEYATPPKMRRDCLSTFNSGADMRYRPQFDDWSMTIDLVFDASAITVAEIANWFRLGGFTVGLGENRTEKSADGWGSFRLATGGDMDAEGNQVADTGVF